MFRLLSYSVRQFVLWKTLTGNYLPNYIYIYIYKKRSQGSVYTVTRLQAAQFGTRLLAAATHSSLLKNAQNGSGTQSASYSTGARSSFPDSKATWT